MLMNNDNQRKTRMESIISYHIMSFKFYKIYPHPVDSRLLDFRTSENELWQEI